MSDAADKPEGPEEEPAAGSDSSWDVVPPIPAPPADDTHPEVVPPAPPPQEAAPAPPPAIPTMPRKSGPGMGAGVGIGCAAYALGVPIMLGSLSATAAAGFLGVLWPFILIAVISALLMIPEKTRRVGAGMLIASAAAWIVVIGPCIALLYNIG